MIEYIGGFDSDEEGVPLLSSPNFDGIITIGNHIFSTSSLRTLSLQSLRDIIVNSKCQLCSILTLGLPKELEQDLLKLVPGDYWVRLDLLKLVPRDY